jgi:hypothetical protein
MARVGEPVSASRHPLAARLSSGPEAAPRLSLIERLKSLPDALNARRARAYALALVLMTFVPYLLPVGTAVVKGTFPLFADGSPIGGDLASHLLGGRLLLDGDLDNLYDLGDQENEWRSWLPQADFNPYVSPPFMALVYAPLAALPYGVALALWTLISAALIVVSLRLLWPMVPNLDGVGKRGLLIHLLCAPPVLYLFLGGQDTAVSLALLAGGLSLFRSGKQMSAGALLGLGVLKPQLIAVIPILLLAQRRWHALAGWVAVAGSLTVLSMAMVGVDGVRDYVSLPRSDFYRISVVEGRGWEMQSFVALARAMLPGGASSLVTILTVAVGTIAIGLLVRAAHRTRNVEQAFTRLFALALLTIPFVSPHLFLYDCLVFVIPVLFLLDAGVYVRQIRWALIIAYLALWTTPYRHFAVETADWPVTMLVAPFALVGVLMLYRVLYTLHVERKVEVAPAHSIVPRLGYGNGPGR